jgi:hypothetical protein
LLENVPEQAGEHPLTKNLHRGRVVTGFQLAAVEAFDFDLAEKSQPERCLNERAGVYLVI